MTKNAVTHGQPSSSVSVFLCVCVVFFAVCGRRGHAVLRLHVPQLLSSLNVTLSDVKRSTTVRNACRLCSK